MLKDLIQSETKHSIPVISKIEKPQAINKLESILKVSDGLMVARGDLGLEIPTEEVPLNQKIMVEMAKKARKPVIVATQMMESMIDNLTPSRAGSMMLQILLWMVLIVLCFRVRRLLENILVKL